MNKVDAIRMVRDIRDRQQTEIAGKTPDQIRDYFRQKSQWVFRKSTANPISTQK